MHKILLQATIAAAGLLASSVLIPSQQSVAQTVSVTNSADALSCSTSAPTRPGSFLTIDGVDGPDGHPCQFEIKDFSFGVENPTTIGSATGGAGAGKINFKEFTVKKKVDSASPLLFKNCASGQHYSNVTLTMRKAGGRSTSAGMPFLRYSFETVFTTKIDWSGPGDEGPEESITFVYGALSVEYHRPPQ